MLTLSLAKCLKATKNGSFKTADLKPSSSLTYDDLVFLTEYLRITPLTELDLSMDVTEENVYGLKELSKVIGQKKDLINLRFNIESSEFHLSPSDNIIFAFLNYFNNSIARKMGGLVYDAVVNMVKNKSQLEQLTIDLGAIETAAKTSQSYSFAKKIQGSPLKSLKLNFKVENNAELPILDKQNPNTNLVNLELRGLSLGKDILQYLQQTNALQVLVIDDMLFESTDIPLIETVFKSNPSLSFLVLSNTNIGQIASPQLLASLKLCSKLSNLDLSGNNLSRLNIDALCNYLSDSCTLRELGISHNAYMASDAKKLAEALASNKNIEKLIVDGNYIENEGLQAIIQLMNTNKNIITASMSKNCRYSPSDETIRALCNYLQDPECRLKDLEFVQDTSIDQLKMLRDAILANSSLASVKLNFLPSSIIGVVYKIEIQEHVDGLSPLAKSFTSQISVRKDEPIATQQEQSKASMSSGDGFFANQNTAITNKTAKLSEVSLNP